MTTQSAPAKPANFELSLNLWKPFALTAAYLAFLRFESEVFFTETTDEGNLNSFQRCSIAAPAIASAIYLSCVFLGPKLMRDRKPFVISDYMFTYNIYQTVLNLWMVVAMIGEVIHSGMSIWGNEIDNTRKGYRISFLVWVHYNNKFVELLDTAFMILRKKDKQLSFLHVYHHVLLIWSWFLVVKISATGDAYFGAACNSFVHVVMYSYYCSAQMGWSCPWKRNITQMQMIQFVVCAAHAIYVFYKGNMPAVLAYMQLWVMVNMLVLFGQFYRESYQKNAAKKAAAPAQVTANTKALKAQ